MDIEERYSIVIKEIKIKNLITPYYTHTRKFKMTKIDNVKVYKKMKQTKFLYPPDNCKLVQSLWKVIGCYLIKL